MENNRLILSLMALKAVQARILQTLLRFPGKKYRNDYNRDNLHHLPGT